MSNRFVEVYEWVTVPMPDTSYYKQYTTEKQLVGTGIFHGFGNNFEEFETGPGNFSTAIVEMPDGSIRNTPVEMVKFITTQGRA